MIAFLTGATEYLGEAVLRELLAKGWRVRALIDPGADASHLKDLSFDAVAGDLAGIDALRRGTVGADAVFHAALAAEPWLADRSTWRRVNDLGTKTLLSIAAQSGAERVVIAGGIEVAARVPGAFTKTRWEGIEAGFKRNFKGVNKEMEVLAVHPGVMLGPRDRRPSYFGRILLDFLGGAGGWLPRGGLPVIDVDDAASAMVLAAERGVPGAEYAVVAEYLPLEALFGVLGQITGREARPRFLPRPLARDLSFLAELGARFSKKPPRVPLSFTRLVTHWPRRIPSGEASRRVLRLPQQRLAEESLARAVGWWAEHGMMAREQVGY